jgi:hypothetical protein
VTPSYELTGSTPAWTCCWKSDQLVALLSERRWKKAEAIVKRIEPRPYPFSEPKATVTGTVEERDGQVTAVVTVVPDPLTATVPPPSEIARKWRD